MEEMNILEVQNAKKYFANVRAVDDLTFKLKKGEIYGLLGPNGAGKTTTVKLILGLLEADEGNISVMGLHPEKDEIELIC